MTKVAKRVRTIGAGEFKAKCLRLIDEVAETGEEIVITKRGKVRARIVPEGVELSPDELERKRRAAIDKLSRSITYVGDVESPIDRDWQPGRNLDR